MATSGSTSVTVTSWDTLKFSWSQSSQSIAANTTTITWKLQLIAGSSGRISSTASKDWSVTVNGTKYSGTNTIGISNNATKTLASGTTVISHNSDGTKTFSYSFSQEIRITFSGTYIGTKSGSGSGTLNTIPRATTPTLSASSAYMGDKVTISLPRASSSLLHDLAYSFNGGAYVKIEHDVATSYTWTVPDVATSIPNATSGVMTVRCITLSGDTEIGRKTVTMTAKVPENVTPTCSIGVSEATAGLAEQFGAYIQGQSKLAVTLSASGAKGSTIKSYQTNVSPSAGLKTSYYTAASFTTETLPQSGQYMITTKVADSRGRTYYTSVKVDVLAYTAPQITVFKAERCTPDGVLSDEGEAALLTFAYTVPALNGGNTAAVTVEYKRGIDNTYETTPLYQGSDLSGEGSLVASSVAFSTDYRYDIRLTVADWFGEARSYVTQLPSDEVILDILGDGSGISFGGTADRPGALFHWPAKGKVFGLGEATAVLPENADLNDYHEPGIYSTGGNTNTATLQNCPSQYAGTVRVYNALGDDKNEGAWVYMIQEYRSYWVSEPTYRRLLQTGEDGSWTASDWVEA